MRLHIVKRSHSAPGNAVVRTDTGGAPYIEPIKDFEVGLTFRELKEGEWHEDGATLSAPWGMGTNDNDLMEFLQAIVNEASKLGIYPAGMEDMSREVATLRAHLEDMRKLVFKGPGYERLKP